jgi:plasmid stabilization system protein ParE
METSVIWTNRALATLDNIFEFYKEKSENAAIKIVNRLYYSAGTLKTFPNAGAIEPLLDGFSVCFRSLVVEKHFKLIYYTDENRVYITEVWDTRQNPYRLTGHL